ncbi:S-methyl-5-thioribose-1-phosphate isomerase [Candidatus Woesearchaeota archaeon]|nr:S-methyl-5-thioribose-1-phosphate isomerase [Candidatus Woesearchaeota archaeon]
MKVDDKHFRTIWVNENDEKIIQIIDQRKLPHLFEIFDIKTVDDAAKAIKEMYVHGAGLIGATAGYGMYIAALQSSKQNTAAFDEDMRKYADQLIATRPTAKNLEWAVKRQLDVMATSETPEEKVKLAFITANEIADEDTEYCRRLGEHGCKIIEEISKKKGGETVNILTHCNAGWLAFVDYGSATAPIYAAFEKGIKVHVWVDETRPRSQGASLTSWELGKHGVPHTLIVDNVGGHIMQHGMVDMCIVGTDRTTHTGDVANKIGTYLKALAAKDNNVPFYVALPSSTFDWEMEDGLKEIPIEERDQEEVRYVWGKNKEGKVEQVLICPETTPAGNYAFDVTPSRLITGLITERGVCEASREGVHGLYPNK